MFGRWVGAHCVFDVDYELIATFYKTACADKEYFVGCACLRAYTRARLRACVCEPRAT